MKIVKRVSWGLGLLLLIAIAIAVFALKPEARTSIEARIKLLEPSMVIVVPEGEGPFPVVLLFHGCGGLVSNSGEKLIMRNYAEAAADIGYIAIIVDSYGPRSISFNKALSQVCSGMKLRGRSRAGDIVAALSFAGSLPNASQKGHVIAGWSHGGWSVMELATMDLQTSWPTSLKKDPSTLLDTISGLYITYPYCGFPATSPSKTWALQEPTSVVIAEHDSISQLGQCATALKKMHSDGVPLEVEIIDDVTHAFDEEDQTDGSIFEYDERAAAHALYRFQSFLSDVRDGAPFPNDERMVVPVE